MKHFKVLYWTINGCDDGYVYADKIVLAQDEKDALRIFMKHTDKSEYRDELKLRVYEIEILK